MAEDFPAAHSHDTLWFAVDEAGHVGVFWSGPLGHSPETAENAEDLPGELWRLCHPGEHPAPAYSARFPADPETVAVLGLFYYDYGRAGLPLLPWVYNLEPYHLARPPEAPLHIDQLPPALRERCKRIRFERVHFAQSEWLQPLEQYACDYRYKIERVAYLGGDGKTVRPIPGREEDFRQFCRAFREEHPEEADRLIFEGPPDEPTPQGGQ
jgi:hypothetical protein